MSVLNVGEKIIMDHAIVNSEIHTHQPYTNRFENNDEIRIPVQEDMCTLPSESYIYIEGRLAKADGGASASATFVNNGLAYLFSEIRYEMNGVVVDSATNVGMTSTMKGYLSCRRGDSIKWLNSGWIDTPNSTHKITDNDGNFSACIPLKNLLGFAEDYNKVILNIRQELILIRSNTDMNSYFNNKPEEPVKVTINKIYWKVPHITPGLAQELALTKYIDKNVETPVAFRSWELHTYPAVPQTNKHTWAVKTATKLESPRYIILGFQVNREGKAHSNMSHFDDCDINNVRVYLNTERYPYDNLNINFKKNQWSVLYDMYSRFQSSYYNTDNQPLLDPATYKKEVPLIVINCSHQKDSLNSKAIALRLEFDTNTNIKPDTIAYCLILHDRVFTYNALTKAVRQL